MGEDGGQKMITTKRALKLFLMSLPADSYFSIITYGKKYEWLGGKKKAYKKTDENLQFALEEVKKFKAKPESTNLHSPLAELFKT